MREDPRPDRGRVFVIAKKDVKMAETLLQGIAADADRIVVGAEVATPGGVALS